MYGGEKNQMISKTQKIKPKTCTWKFVLEKKKKNTTGLPGCFISNGITQLLKETKYIDLLKNNTKITGSLPMVLFESVWLGCCSFSHQILMQHTGYFITTTIWPSPGFGQETNTAYFGQL